MKLLECLQEILEYIRLEDDLSGHNISDCGFNYKSSPKGQTVHIRMNEY